LCFWRETVIGRGHVPVNNKAGKLEVFVNNILKPGLNPVKVCGQFVALRFERVKPTKRIAGNPQDFLLPLDNRRLPLRVNGCLK